MTSDTVVLLIVSASVGFSLGLLLTTFILLRRRAAESAREHRQLTRTLERLLAEQSLARAEQDSYDTGKYP